jgi:hypothetical protein
MALTIGLPPMATPESRAKIRSACCRMWRLSLDAGQVTELANLAQPVLRNCWRTLRKNRPFSGRAVRTLERYLAANGLIADDQPATGTSTASELANEYANYLREVRGFAASTVANHRYTVQCFLQHLDGAEIALNKIRVPQIESYIIQAGKRLSRSSLQHDIGALRSFLRFQAIEDRVPSGLASQIDTPRLYQLEKLPRALPWERSAPFCDPSTEPRRWDYATTRCSC